MALRAPIRRDISRVSSAKLADKAAPAPVTAPAPEPAPAWGGGGDYSGGGFVGGGGGGGDSFSAASAPAPAPAMSDDDWLGSDSGYLATIAALNSKLKGFETETEAKKSKGVQDFDTSLSRLGWLKDKNDWSNEDRTTAFGNSFQSLLGDFASRGLLQSSLYDQANTDLTSEFNRQKTDMDSNQKSFLDEIARALSQTQTETTQSKDQARLEALARRAASV